MQDNNTSVPLIFGEVLFDCFPDGGSVLGGAPFNVAWHLQAFGQQPRMISRVGRDSLGEKVATEMERWGMSTLDLQWDDDHPTGTVQITLNEGEPAYEIVPDQAYDHIDAGSIDLPGTAALLYHGSLALRQDGSRKALLDIVARTDAKILLDVNLRAPWWGKDEILSYCDSADWVKLNDDELRLLGTGKDDPEAEARRFMDTHTLEGVVVTMGSEGVMAFTAEGDIARARPSAAIDVVDTVGAGDALTSVFITGLLRGWSLQRTLERAQSFASVVVGQQGATIDDHDVYSNIIEQWTT